MKISQVEQGQEVCAEAEKPAPGPAVWAVEPRWQLLSLDGALLLPHILLPLHPEENLTPESCPEALLLLTQHPG